MARVTLFPDHLYNDRRYAYCLCLHVRPATIFVALVNLGGSLLCTILSLYILFNGAKPGTFASNLVREDGSPLLGTSLLLYPLLSLISAMLLYGAVKSKPSYILPFFAVQFIDYLFTIPHFLASIYTQPFHRYYLSKAREQLDMMEESSTGKTGGFPDSANMVTFSSETVSTSILLALIVILFKTYFLCVVWKCYRYLHMQDFILPFSLNTANLNGEHIIAPIVVAHSMGTAPPNYEEATNMPEYNKPPEYDLAVQLTIADPIDSNNPATTTTTTIPMAPSEPPTEANQSNQTKPMGL